MISTIHLKNDETSRFRNNRKRRKRQIFRPERNQITVDVCCSVDSVGQKRCKMKMNIIKILKYFFRSITSMMPVVGNKIQTVQTVGVMSSVSEISVSIISTSSIVIMSDSHVSAVVINQEEK